jgi:predicted metalloenzyme YecM
VQDKSFQQAIQDLQDRISSNFQTAINHMLLHGTTATNATLDIKDEKMRAAVTDMLISGQIMALLTLMRDLQILDKAHHDEFIKYLLSCLSSRHGQFPL